MIPVVIESPYAGEVEENVAYLQRCILDCIKRFETPYASHRMLTMALDDLDPEERTLGIKAGMEMRDHIVWGEEQTARTGRHIFYLDRGISNGMAYALEHSAKVDTSCAIFRWLETGEEHEFHASFLMVSGGNITDPERAQAAERIRELYLQAIEKRAATTS